MSEFWQLALTLCGIGAVGSLVFFSLYREWLKVDVFSRLTKSQTFRLMIVFMVLSFLFAIGSLITFGLTSNEILTAARIGGAPALTRALFDDSKLQFDIVVRNNSHKAVILTKIGVRTVDTRGSFQCLSGAKTLSAIADYILRFHVTDNERIVDADPPIAISSDESGRFTVSLRPDATGACGYWSTRVSALVGFDDGTVIETEPTLISTLHVSRVQTTQPSDTELISALRHRDPGIRVEAIVALKTSGLDRLQIMHLLRARLSDTHTGVQLTAAGVASEMGLTELSMDLVKLLNRSIEDIPEFPPEAEVKDYGSRIEMNDDVSAEDREDVFRIWKQIERMSNQISSLVDDLAQLQATEAIDPILKAHLHPAFHYPFYTASALARMEHPDVMDRVRPIIMAGPPARDTDVTGRQSRKFIDLYEVAIAYRDQASTTLIDNLLRDPSCENTFQILSAVDELVEQDELVSDPFVLGLRGGIETALNCPISRSRERAMLLLAKLPLRRDELKQMLRERLSDSNIDVQVSAAMVSAQLQLRELIPEVNHLVATLPDSTREWQREKVSQALAILEEETNK